MFRQPCLEQWNDNFPTFAGVIERKLGEEAYGGLQFNNFRIIGFVDCKISETCRPGSGPAEDRQQALRHDDAWILQESVYSGYVRRHGLKNLSVVFPNGLIGYVYGPISARENDNGALNGSELNQHMMDLQVEVMQAREQGEQVYFFLFMAMPFFYFTLYNSSTQSSYWRAIDSTSSLELFFFIYNCYTCLNGSEFSRFFDVQPPSLKSI